MELLLKNGIVYDPTNGIRGEKCDIALRDGKIVEHVNESTATVIDVSNKLVLPGGVDPHSHIAGPKVNLGRLLRPEDHYKDPERRTEFKRSGVGYSIPSTFTTGYRYAEMGYTTVFEPANPPLKMLHVHHELNDTPIVDKGSYPLFGNNWFVMDFLKDGRVDECAAYVGWVLQAVKGYAIKIVDPGSVENWKWGGGVKNLDDQVPHFNLTPREIVKGLCKVAKLLKLPHHLHVHPNFLGTPGNYKTTLATLDSVADQKSENRPVIHLAHAQFHCYGGEDWPSITPKAEEVASYLNKNDHVSADLGQVVFTDTTTMTADGPFEFKLQQLTKNKWINADIEVETGTGIVPFRYSRRNLVHAVMWATGLEFALLMKEPWRLVLTTDHPNGAPFTTYPRVMSWLMSSTARGRMLKKINSSARRRSILGSIDREYTLEEIAIITRAAPAKLLGLKSKGHLGVGADADVSVYDIDPTKLDPSRDYRKIRKSFRRSLYTVKDGQIVAKEGEIVATPTGKTFWVEPHVPEDMKLKIQQQLESSFDDFYTVKMENYKIAESYLIRSAPVICDNL